MRRRSLLSIALATAFCLAGAARAAERVDLLIVDATVIDVATGALSPKTAIAVRGGDIIAVGPSATARKTYTASKVVQAGGRFVMPGLWDNHVHFGGGPDLIGENKALLPLYLAHGITSVRDASGDLPLDVLAWRDEVAAGKLLGPTIYSSGPKIEGLKPIWKGTLATTLPPYCQRWVTVRPAMPRISVKK